MKKILINLSLLPIIILFPAVANAEDEYIAIPPPVPTVNYQLPDPGILPDNSIYILKTIRDKISIFIIGNPLKRAEFNLIKADTRISAALFLSEQEKNASLTEETALKAEDYFEQALNSALETKAQGIDVDDFVKRLATANKKHQEVIEIIEKNIHKKDSKKFEIIKKRVEDLGKGVNKISL